MLTEHNTDVYCTGPSNLPHLPLNVNRTRCKYLVGYFLMRGNIETFQSMACHSRLNMHQRAPVAQFNVQYVIC